MHHLPPEQKEKDADNRAALTRMYPHYVGRASFTVCHDFWWYDPVQRRNVYTDQTVMIISFAAERANDPAPEDEQPTLWGQVAEDNKKPGG